MTDSQREMLAVLSERYPGKSALDVKEACKELSISRNCLLAIINRRGGIKAADIGRGANHVWRISIAEIARHLS